MHYPFVSKKVSDIFLCFVLIFMKRILESLLSLCCIWPQTTYNASDFGSGFFKVDRTTAASSLESLLRLFHVIKFARHYELGILKRFIFSPSLRLVDDRLRATAYHKVAHLPRIRCHLVHGIHWPKLRFKFDSNRIIVPSVYQRHTPPPQNCIPAIYTGTLFDIAYIPRLIPTQARHTVNLKD